MSKVKVIYNNDADCIEFSNGEWIPISYLDIRNDQNSLDEWRKLYMKSWFTEDLLFDVLQIVEDEGQETDYATIMYEAGRWSIYKMLCGQVDIDFTTQIYVAAYLKKVQVK